MEYILKLLKRYDVDYNRKTKVLTIQQPIEVPIFIFIKSLLKPYLDDSTIKDLRVDTIKVKYERRF
jgi:hypothetical protein